MKAKEVKISSQRSNHFVANIVRPTTPIGLRNDKNQLFHQEKDKRKARNFKRPRLGSDTTHHDSYRDYNAKIRDVFCSIRKILEEKRSKNSKKAQNREILEIPENSNRRLDENPLPKLLEALEKQRAREVKPTRKVEFKPNVDIFGNCSKSSVSQGSDETSERRTLVHDKRSLGKPSDSLKVNFDENSSQPSSEEILFHGTEKTLRDMYERYSGKRDSLNTCQRMNDIILNHKRRLAHLYNCPDKEIIEYEDQTRKEEIDFLHPEHKRISLFHLENFSPNKKYKISRQLKNRLIHKREKIFELGGKNAKKSKPNQKHGSRNKKTLHAGDPKMYHNVQGDVPEFYTDFEKQMDKKEAEAQGNPLTPSCTPTIPVKRKPATLSCAYHNKNVEDCTKMAKHGLINVAWTDNFKVHNFKNFQRKV
ncbi:unnamed protein product [Moneuplotes crassus]|uniref:Uncharacterized protein n=1 Tax=Euplotes crassus TaxID=5936 RepID=A0AAD1UIH8_EUPCR|nr:unnamed protein product [Moneuplotes crassus]